MAVLAQCPNCWHKQNTRRKKCRCGTYLDPVKRMGRVRYWVQYRELGRRQTKKFIGNSLKEARYWESKQLKKLHKNLHPGLPGENWKQASLDGTVLPYEVSNYGRIRVKKTGRVLKPTKQSKGYLRVTLAGGQSVLVHRLVLETFQGPQPEGHETNHKDLDKENNQPSNLEWITHRENIKHYRRSENVY